MRACEGVLLGGGGEGGGGCGADGRTTRGSVIFDFLDRCHFSLT